MVRMYLSLDHAPNKHAASGWEFVEETKSCLVSCLVSLLLLVYSFSMANMDTRGAEFYS